MLSNQVKFYFVTLSMLINQQKCKSVSASDNIKQLHFQSNFEWTRKLQNHKHKYP